MELDLINLLLLIIVVLCIILFNNNKKKFFNYFFPSKFHNKQVKFKEHFHTKEKQMINIPWNTLKNALNLFRHSFNGRFAGEHEFNKGVMPVTINKLDINKIFPLANNIIQEINQNITNNNIKLQIANINNIYRHSTDEEALVKMQIICNIDIPNYKCNDVKLSITLYSKRKLDDDIFNSNENSDLFYMKEIVLSTKKHIIDKYEKDDTSRNMTFKNNTEIKGILKNKNNEMKSSMLKLNDALSPDTISFDNYLKSNKSVDSAGAYASAGAEAKDFEFTNTDNDIFTLNDDLLTSDSF